MKRTAPLAILLAILLVWHAGPGAAGATHAMPCPDLNGDGIVTVLDVAIESSYVGQTVPPAPPQADMDGDLDIDGDDVAYFSPPLVPQPQWIASCQDKPIGPASPVGGLTQLAAPILGGEGEVVITWPLAALAALFGVTGLVLVASRRRP